MSLITHRTTLVAALILSLLTSGASVYQWWSNRQGEKIRAAIDLSDKYINERIDQRQAQIEINRINVGFDADASASIYNKFHNQAARLEYIAFLANRNLLNYDYLSQFILCDFKYPLERSPEVEAFTKNHTITCAIQSINHLAAWKGIGDPYQPEDKPQRPQVDPVINQKVDRQVSRTAAPE